MHERTCQGIFEPILSVNDARRPFDVERHQITYVAGYKDLETTECPDEAYYRCVKVRGSVGIKISYRSQEVMTGSRSLVRECELCQLRETA